MDSTSLHAPIGRALHGSKRLLALRDDDHLVTRLRAGEALAFEVLYERHVPGVLSFCRHMVGSREEAEDAVQQAFASAHRDLVVRERSDINFKPWIYTIARNRCLSMLRARREDLPEDLERATAGLDTEVQARADLRELVVDLQDLPENQRAALLLTEIRDLSHAEVAEVLDCGAAQVKGLVHRARSGLLERREARDASCEQIRVELAAARGGGFRRGRLRHHLNACPACTIYWEDVRRQRQMLALVLPVIPSLGLKADVLAAIGLGGGAAGGGLAAATGAGAAGAGAAATGGSMVAAATVAKIAAVAAIAGGTGAAGIAAIDADNPPRSKPPAQRADEPRPAAKEGGAGLLPARDRAPAGLPDRRPNGNSTARLGKVGRDGRGTPGVTEKPRGRQSAPPRPQREAGVLPPASRQKVSRRPATGPVGSPRQRRSGRGADGTIPGRGRSGRPDRPANHGRGRGGGDQAPAVRTPNVPRPNRQPQQESAKAPKRESSNSPPAKSKDEPVPE